MFGKGPFGSGLNISAEIVNGVCPKCVQPTILISLYEINNDKSALSKSISVTEEAWNIFFNEKSACLQKNRIENAVLEPVASKFSALKALTASVR